MTVEVKLSRAQSKVLDFIRAFARRTGYPPPRQEIATGVGYASPNAAQEMVERLARKGVLRINKGRNRALVCSE